METLTVSSFRTNMAAAFNRVDDGQRVLIRRNNRYYTITPVVIDSVSELEPNDTTKAAILEARVLANTSNQGTDNIETVDTSSVDAMLKSCGI